MNLLKSGNLLITNLVMKNGRMTNISGGRRASGYGLEGFKEPTISELPLPQGPWTTQYKKLNGKYNRHFIGGVGFYIFTILFIYKSGLVTLNNSIPKLSDFGAIGCVDPPPPPPQC